MVPEASVRYPVGDLDEVPDDLRHDRGVLGHARQAKRATVVGERERAHRAVKREDPLAQRRVEQLFDTAGVGHAEQEAVVEDLVPEPVIVRSEEVLEPVHGAKRLEQEA